MVYQKNSRDCLQASLSNLLNIPYEDIPEFYKMYPKSVGEYSDTDPENYFTKKYDEWLGSVGYFRLKIDVSFDTNSEKIGVPFYNSLEKFKCLGILKKKDKEFSHAVVLEFKRKEREYQVTILDPRKNSEYDLRDIESVELIFKK